MDGEIRYYALQDELRALEEKTGLYLADMNIDAENAGVPREDPSFFDQCYFAACMAAGMRAEEAGADLTALIGRDIY